MQGTIAWWWCAYLLTSQPEETAIEQLLQLGIVGQEDFSTKS
jgi:hypothetical protein